jgi:hypothetical protein
VAALALQPAVELAVLVGQLPVPAQDVLEAHLHPLV